MADHIYKIIEITGTSRVSVDEAIKAGLKRASETLDELRWFQVSEIRGSIDQKSVDHYQVTMKVGFTLKEA